MSVSTKVIVDSSSGYNRLGLPDYSLVGGDYSGFCRSGIFYPLWQALKKVAMFPTIEDCTHMAGHARI